MTGRQMVALGCYGAVGACLGIAFFAAQAGNGALILRALAGAMVFFLAGRIIWRTGRHL